MRSIAIYIGLLIFVASAAPIFGKPKPSNAVVATKKLKTAKIAVVDIQSILEHSLAMKAIRKSMNVISASLQEQLLDSEQELKNIEQKLIVTKGELTEKEFDIQTEIFNKKVAKAQAQVQEKKQKLDQAHAEAVLKVNDTIMDIISEISLKKNIGVVLPSSQTLFAAESFNITDSVIRLLNNRLKYVKINFEC